MDSPEYWLNIFEEMKNGHTLEIKFKEYNKDDLEIMEKYHIYNEMPISQICTGNKPDNIIPLESRLFNLSNIKEYYYNYN